MTEKKSVCGDLIERLESQLPNTVVTEKGGSALIKKFFGDVFPLEAVIAELDLQIKAEMDKIELGPPPGAPKETEESAITQDPEPSQQEHVPGDMSEHYLNLKDIVEEFNAKLDKWYEDSGCVVNFSWSYSGGKKLEISGVDYIVYRKPAPSAETLKTVISKANL